ncbi:MmgE/PrpD family protein [Gordonia sp. ABSL11-1]|uniref:MmgE/PrpD family protein n=1 Tax=Gordonia sp. ABSL11-1 TaxID=3053924 RepID=UPI00257368B0|nr:MmgE/PrpD family protein [Gordonia sp. ABSL11-1]MDL9948170.1 MmgE/PrpD family protein [Gordonia sp. ABSL11-1]
MRKSRDSNVFRGSSSTVTQEVARSLTDLNSMHIPTEVQQKVTTCLLDCLSCSFDSLTVPWRTALDRYIVDRSGIAQARHWGTGGLVSAEDAAFGNSALAHSLIRDDVHVSSSTHIGVLVLPAVLALAERERWSGKAVVRGIVAGYEMAIALGSVIQDLGAAKHFRPSGVNGAFGAVSGAIAAAELDEPTAVSALGFAVNAVSGFNEWPWSGGEEVYVHTAVAARSGVLAFDLARSGLRSSASALDGRDGLFQALGAASGPQLMFERLRAVRRDGPSGLQHVRHKPYSGCNYIQSPIAAALEVRRNVVDRVQQISAVTIGTSRRARDYPGCNNRGPFTRLQQSKMSMQYAVASALVCGRVDEQTYTRYSDPAIVDLAARCRIEIDPSIEAAARSRSSDKQPARVQVQFSDGETVTASVDDVPWLDASSVELRFRHAAAGALEPDRIDRIVELVSHLGELEDCAALSAAVAGPKRPGGSRAGHTCR